MNSYPWLEIKGYNDYERGIFCPFCIPSIASSDTADEVQVPYIDEADATSAPTQHAAASEANPPPPPVTEATTAAPTATPTASLAGTQGSV